MLSKSACLHIPPLYEEGVAKILWESSDGADGYELDVHYDEDFETASTGKSWSDIDNSELATEEIEVMNLTWEQIAKLPAQGFSWRNIAYHNPTWNEIDEDRLSWKEIQGLPVEFTEYKGAGEKTRGPDQGLSWSNIDSSEMDWTQIEALVRDWDAFMFQPSVGLNWAQLQSDNLSWSEIEAKAWTWRDFERQTARGLGWESLDARFLSWSEIEAKNLYWDQLEHLPPDSKTHISHVIDIPIYKKKAILRVRAYKGGEYSEYLTSSLINTLPRSLKKYKAPCLHIPALYEGKAAEIIWGDLYGASGYILERKCSGGFEACFDGPGKPVPHPNGCKKPDELYYTPDCKQHLACTDNVPYYEKTAQYRVKGYNTTDGSQYLESAVIPIIPVFYREDRVTVNAVGGSKYLIQIQAKEIEDFKEIVMTLRYDSLALQLEKLVFEQPGGKTDIGGALYSANNQVISQKAGTIQFRCTRQMKTKKEWGGLIVSVKFNALKNLSTNITLS